MPPGIGTTALGLVAWRLQNLTKKLKIKHYKLSFIKDIFFFGNALDFFVLFKKKKFGHLILRRLFC